MYKIYSLEDPISKEIKYIGQTTLSLEKRLNLHLYKKSNSIKKNWIDKLKLEKLKPIIQIIDIVENNEEFWEQYYISLYKSWGFNLVNSTEGGKGIIGYKHTIFTKNVLKIANTGKIHSEEAKNKMKGRKLSTITKNRIGKAFSKSILQYDLEGNLIKEWNSIREASRKLKISVSNICMCCKGQIKKSRGYVWKYKL